LETSNKNSIKLIIYDNAANYLKACQKNEKLKSTILFAIDYFPAETYGYFDLLRTTALKKNGWAWTVINQPILGEPDKDTDIVPVEYENYYLATGNADSLLLYEWQLKDKKFKNKKLEYWPLKPRGYSNVPRKNLIIKVDRFNPLWPIKTY